MQRCAPDVLEGQFRRFLNGRGDAMGPLFAVLGDDRGERAGERARAALILSRIYILKGSTPLAASYLAVASRLFRIEDGPGASLGLLVNRALIFKALGRPDAAERLLRRAFTVSVRESRVLPAAKAASNLSVLLSRTGRAAEADHFLAFARRTYRELGLDREIAVADLAGAVLEAGRGNLGTALDLSGACMVRCERAGLSHETIVGRLLMAEFLIGLGEQARAHAMLDAVGSGGSPLLTRFRPLELCYRGLRRRLSKKTRRPAVYPAPSRGDQCSGETAPARACTEAPGGDVFVTGDPHMRSILAEMESAAPLPLAVLILGESGVGKEILARLVHRWSGRTGKPFVAVNIASLPSGLFESALFGHRRGAFTGAAADRSGLVEAAGDGTLFLDEIGELAAPLQAKLLRFLDGGVYIPVGGTAARRCRARIVAATNCDLETAIELGTFRKDLYYRIAVLTYRIPPLRDRRSDILLLAGHILENMSGRYGLGRIRLGEGASAVLERYDWPGNVRQLEHELARAALRARRGLMHLYHLSPSLLAAASTLEGRGERAGTLDGKVRRLQKDEILAALECSGGNLTRAAAKLGLKRTTLIYRMRRLGIE